MKYILCLLLVTLTVASVVEVKLTKLP